jgi:AcrR family transcriptional regulator
MPASDQQYASVWAKPRRPGRSTLTREQIVSEAMALLDGEGIDALSMRRLATRLGSGATSLYWHVANRDELIELVIDEVHGELELPPAGMDDWQEAMRIYARSLRSTAVRHRWLASVVDHLAAAHLGPKSSQAAEQVLAVLEEAGFPLRECERINGAVASYVLGVAVAEAGWANWLARRGQTAEEWVAASQQAAVETTVGLDRLQRVIEGYAGIEVQQAMDDDFHYGLDCLLDGIAARLPSPADASG